jgi:hypothetical protein
MKDSVMADNPNEFMLALFGLKLSAKGAVALVLALPVSVVLIAAAWRVAFG